MYASQNCVKSFKTYGMEVDRELCSLMFLNSPPGRRNAKHSGAYQNAPNRGHHLPYVQAIAACKDAWDIRVLIEIQHGRVQI